MQKHYDSQVRQYNVQLSVKCYWQVIFDAYIIDYFVSSISLFCSKLSEQHKDEGSTNY